MVLLCSLRDRYQLQTSVKEINNIHFFRLTALDIINFARGLKTLFEHISVQSYCRKVVAHVNYLRLTRPRSHLQWSSMPPSPFFALNGKPRGT